MVGVLDSWSLGLSFCTARRLTLSPSFSVGIRRISQQRGGRSLSRRGAARLSFSWGGLHGDNETQTLVQDLGQALEPFGYRYTAAEMSAWAADRLLTSLGAQDRSALWGADIEEVQPHLVIRELAAANPQNKTLQSMLEMIRAGYRRSLAPALLGLLQQGEAVNDVVVQGTSLRTIVLRTLQVEVERSDPATSLAASVHRENFMKEVFVANYRRSAQGDLKPIDFLASVARFPATVFDLRPLRQTLRQIPAATRSARDASLLYWSDSYDAILCYREVTPAGVPPSR